jgi:hypothetical protein
MLAIVLFIREHGSLLQVIKTATSNAVRLG